MNMKKILQSIRNEYFNLKIRIIRTRHPAVYTYNEIPFGILPKSTRLGHGGLGIVINKGAKIGENVFIGQNVTIGGKKGKTPTIQKYVEIYSNASIIGDVIVGHHSKVAPGAVVFKHIPPYSLVVGYSIIYKNKYKQKKVNKEDNINKELNLPPEDILDLMSPKELKRLIYSLAAEKYIKASEKNL